MTSCPKPGYANRPTEGNETNEEGTVRVRRTSRAYLKMRSSRRKETLIFCKRWVFEPPCVGCYDEKGILRPALRSLRLLLFNSAPMAVLFAVVALFPAVAQAQEAIEAWVQRYNGPGNWGDYARAVAVDAAGNVYVTGGSSDGEYSYGLTIAYSSAGVPLWTNRFHSGAESTDCHANAVAVDKSGNVFVTGSGGGCLTIAYSSAGVPLWTNQYHPPGYTWSGASVITLDGSGSVIVAGDAGQPASSGDYLVIKYSSSGTLVWAKTHFHGGVRGLAADANDNVFVAGPATVKFSSAGGLLWSRDYPDINGAQAMAVDSAGNVFVTGFPYYSGTARDWLTIKYSGAGVPLWTNRYNGPESPYDEPHAMAADANGNVIVTGQSGPLFATIKYSGAGVPLWTNRYSGGNAEVIALDARGNVFVAGVSTASSSGWDYGTLAYSSDGVQLWAKQYNGLGTTGNDLDELTAIAVDANANVYVTGHSAGSDSNQDYATIKYVTLPFITRQPVSRTNAVGTLASFDVEAIGSGPFGYQWRKDGKDLSDGGNLSGASTTNLLVADVQTVDAGDYTVVVTNGWGSATSTIAHLTVMVPPSGGRFGNLSYSPATGFSFVFRDGTVGQSYRIQRSASAAEGSWVDWQSFTYSEPILLTDMGATGAERSFYRAVSPGGL